MDGKYESTSVDSANTEKKTWSNEYHLLVISSK